MAQQDRSEIILIIKTFHDDSIRSLRSARNQNAGYLTVDDFDHGNDVPVGSASRESTPFIPRVSGTQLQLKSGNVPQDPSRGFSFGSGESCDIHLQEVEDLKKKDSIGVSRTHFFVNFNWMSGALMLHNLSKNGLGLESDTLGEQGRWLDINW